MQRQQYTWIGLAAIIAAILASSCTGLATGAYKVADSKMTLRSTTSKPLQWGLVRTVDEPYNIQAYGTGAGGYMQLAGGGGYTLTTTTATATESPKRLDSTTTNSFSYNPENQATWIGLYNTTSTRLNATIGLERMEETIGVGGKATIDVNNTLTVLVLHANLQGDTPYILFYKNVIGTFNTRISTITCHGPDRNAVTVSPQGTYGAYYYRVFVPKASGVHKLSFTLTVETAKTVAEFELKAIPVTALTPNAWQTWGDDPLTVTADEISRKRFSFQAFAMDVAAGDMYTYLFQQAAAGARIYRALPGTTSYTFTSHAFAATLGRAGGIALANGRVMIIAIEETFNQAVQYGTLFEREAPVALATNASTPVTIAPYAYKIARIALGGTSLLRLFVNKSQPGPDVAVSNPYTKVGTMLVALTGNQYINVNNASNTNNRFDGILLADAGEYYVMIDNLANGIESKLAIMTEIRTNPVREGLTAWQDTYNSTLNSYIAFNDASDFQFVSFADLGKGTGAKVPLVYKVSVSSPSFLRFRFQIDLGRNPQLNTGDSWMGYFDMDLVGPHGFYPGRPFLTDWLPGGWTNTFAFTNVTAAATRQFQTSHVTLHQPGEYYLVLAWQGFVNNTGGANRGFNSPISLSVRIQNYSHHLLWDEYRLTGAQPVYNAYGYAAGTYQSRNYLNFSSAYTTPASYAWKRDSTFNGRRYNWGLMLKITNATAFRWTQLLVRFNNTYDLSTPSPGPAEAHTTGISLIYPAFWGPGGIAMYNHKVSWVTSFRGQAIDSGIHGHYALEFGAYASEFYLWINSEVASTDMDFTQTLAVEIRQYETPTVSAGVVAGLDLVVLAWIVGLVGAGAAVAIVLVVIVKKKKRF